MQLTVIVDDRGSIVGTAQAGKLRAQDGHEVEFGIVAGPGQSIHNVEVPDAVVRGSPAELHAHVLGLVQPLLPGFPKGKQG